jgi:hypothetical protein
MSLSLGFFFLALFYNFSFDLLTEKLENVTTLTTTTTSIISPEHDDTREK